MLIINIKNLKIAKRPEARGTRLRIIWLLLLCIFVVYFYCVFLLCYCVLLINRAMGSKFIDTHIETHFLELFREF